MQHWYCLPLGESPPDIKPNYCTPAADPWDEININDKAPICSIMYHHCNCPSFCPSDLHCSHPPRSHPHPFPLSDTVCSPANEPNSILCKWSNSLLTVTLSHPKLPCHALSHIRSMLISSELCPYQNLVHQQLPAINLFPMIDTHSMVPHSLPVPLPPSINVTRAS